MPKPIISEKLIVTDRLGPDCSAEAVISVLCQRLQAEGYVEPGYLEAVLERERRFPTALPTQPYATAIPHADSAHVRETGMAIAVLNNAVPFRAMDSPDHLLPVRAVLLLAVADSSRQTATLVRICEILNRQEAVQRLVSAKTPRAAMAVLQPLLQPQKEETSNHVRDR